MHGSVTMLSTSLWSQWLAPNQFSTQHEAFQPAIQSERVEIEILENGAQLPHHEHSESCPLSIDPGEMGVFLHPPSTQLGGTQ